MTHDRRPARGLLVFLATLALVSAGAAAFVLLNSRGLSHRNGAHDENGPALLEHQPQTSREGTLDFDDAPPAAEREIAADDPRGGLRGPSAFAATAAPPQGEGPMAPPQSPPTPTEPPSVVAVKRTLEPIATRHGDTRLAYVDCPQEPCSARVDARSLTDLHGFLQEASAAYDGHVGMVVKERLDAFTGRWFEAHLEIGTDAAWPVPSLAEDLAHLREVSPAAQPD